LIQVLTQPAGMSTGDWISAAENIVQAAAIVVGGIWAYWKFVRGRTFHRRAELDVDASLIVAEPPRVVRARLTMENTGASDIPFRAKVVRVFAFAPGETDPKTREKNWRLIGTTGVFKAHDWIESHETISDDILVQLEPNADSLNAAALRATCIVLGTRKWKLFGRKSSTAWTSHSVIPVRGPTMDAYAKES
jgi:hypothetical protein